MRAVIVAVNYDDLLSVTLPYNRRHFDDVLIVTSNDANGTVDIANRNDCRFYQTDAFYRDGAVFNKFRALEEGLDVFGRHGWLCLMDADVLWPKDVKLCGCGCHSGKMRHFRACCKVGEGLTVGNLYSPLRHMMVELPVPFALPQENEWGKFPIHRNVNEWAGYTQIFHADDPHLPKAPWHEVNWKHAGGADSFFQRLWPAQCKVRTPWNCLHLGPAGENWCGRASKLLDGTRPEGGQERKEQVRAFIRSRRPGQPDPYVGERLSS